MNVGLPPWVSISVRDRPSGQSDGPGAWIHSAPWPGATEAAPLLQESRLFRPWFYRDQESDHGSRRLHGRCQQNPALRNGFPVKPFLFIVKSRYFSVTLKSQFTRLICIIYKDTEKTIFDKHRLIILFLSQINSHAPFRRIYFICVASYSTTLGYPEFL